ncbi:hypothetical protein AQUSIP_23930 [Aquicella siphonis]|uniref:Pilus assembly protein PilP n=1 Tax=Aquicella siphonis TaxID=254247 RepID=A0A5E4PLG1_9COXI|nr:pilus assembly protein PilP [Aquicella siphonis]VVC77066.1 hypothetical protein AQUSIP_23930 [Aquicella siphonis]
MMRELKLDHILIVTTLTLLMSACGDNQRLRETQKFISLTKQKTLQEDNIEAANAQFALPKPVQYQPRGYHAPAGGNVAISKEGVTNPVLMYPVKSLQFVGTLTQDNRIYAYVMTPDGMIYLLKVGDVIGDKSGKIMKIDSGHIEIMEGSLPSSNNKSSGQLVTLELKD